MHRVPAWRRGLVDIVDRGVTFVRSRDGGNFENGENRKAVRRSLVWMVYDEDCAEAFNKAGLQTPEQIISSRGMIVAGAGMLLNSRNNSVLGISEGTRKNAVKSIDNSKVQAFTVGNKTGKVQTFYKNSAFVGASFWSGTYAIEEIVVHEMIHVAGVDKVESTFGGHDLSVYDHYRNILDNCRIDK